MKKLVVVLILTIVTLALVFGSSQESESENDAIKQAALDYIEGWYEGSVERMDRALDPDLNKKGVQVIPKTGKTILNHLRKTNMVEYTRTGTGRVEPGTDLQIDIAVHDVGANIASVRASSLKFVDYIHLARLDGRWQIINVLWEPREL